MTHSNKWSCVELNYVKKAACFPQLSHFFKIHRYSTADVKNWNSLEENTAFLKYICFIGFLISHTIVYTKYVIYQPLRKKSWGRPVTLATAEILRGKNARAFLVCGFFMKSFKKNILKIWKKSWEPFGSYLLNSTVNPAHFHPNWAGLAVLFSRQLLNGSQDFFFCFHVLIFIIFF